MKLSLDNFFLTDNEIRHIIQVNSLEYLILFFHIAHDKYLNKDNINQYMEQYQANTNNKNKILICIDFIPELSLPHIHQTQQIIVDNFHRQMVIFQ